MKTNERVVLARWRMILGKYSENELGEDSLEAGSGVSGDYKAMDLHLDYLYGREYHGRGMREDQPEERSAGTGDSALTIPEWVTGIRELFPDETIEILEKHALEKYQLTELVSDPDVLQKLEPNYELMKTLLSFRHLMNGPVLEMARRIIRKVIEELKERLAKQVYRTLSGRVHRREHSPLPLARNFDWKGTLRENLKNVDPKTGKILIARALFFANQRQRLRWQIIMVVDCSGSMMDSVIHSAVMASIFHGLPTVQSHLVAFDTNIVDLSEQVTDPVEVLLSVQLGGGTNIGQAMEYSETLVKDPHRAIIVLVTDFYEGASPKPLLASIERMSQNGSRILGLAALDAEAKPDYDQQMARRCQKVGAEIAALTPNRLAEWIGDIIH